VVEAGQTVENGTMKDAQTSDPVVSFGAFEVDFQARKLRKHGMRIRLEEQPFQILEMLLDHGRPGRHPPISSRETLAEYGRWLRT